MGVEPLASMSSLLKIVIPRLAHLIDVDVGVWGTRCHPVPFSPASQTSQSGVQTFFLSLSGSAVLREDLLGNVASRVAMEVGGLAVLGLGLW